MPKKGMTEEEMAAAYNAWKESSEWAALEKFRVETEGFDMNTSLKDVC